MLDFLFFGLLTAIGWGVGDFLNARSARKTNPHNALVFTLGMLAAAWLALGIAGGHFVALSWLQLGLALAIGLGLCVGDFIFISAAKSGKIAVASPLLALSAVVAMVLGVGALGESPHWLSLAFAALALAGGVLVGLKSLRIGKLESLVPMMLPAILAHGMAFTLTKVLVAQVGVLSGTAWFEVLMLSYLVPFAWLNRGKISKPVLENVGAAAAYFVGFFSFATALSLGFVSLAAPVANLFPLVAVGLAVLVYGEKLERHQWAGLGLTVLALVGLSI